MEDQERKTYLDIITKLMDVILALQESKSRDTQLAMNLLKDKVTA